MAKQLNRKGERPTGAFYGDDDGTWTYSPTMDIRWSQNWDWAASVWGSARPEKRTNVSVDNATEHHRGFRKALKEIVREYPELLDFDIAFDGAAKPLGPFVGVAAPARVNWSSIVFYHGTSTEIWERYISKKGLVPRGESGSAPAAGHGSSANPSKPDRVYLTTQVGLAHFAALDAAKVHGGQPMVLVIKGVNGDLMVADEDSGKSTAEGSLAVMGAVAYMGTIPPSKIHPDSYLPPQGSWTRMASASTRRVASRYLRARVEKIDEDVIKKLRKDFLLLVGNLKRLKNMDQATKLRKAAIKWAAYLEGLFRQIRPEVEGIARMYPDIYPGDIESYARKQDPIWDFRYEVSDPPDLPKDHEYKPRWGEAESDAQQRVFNAYLEELVKWDKRTRRRAPAAWKWLEGFAAWANRGGYYGGGGAGAEWTVVEKENAVLEGFRVQIINHNGSPEHVQALEQFKAALSTYRKRAERVYPWLLKYQLPLELNFGSERGSGGALATYERDHISVWSWHFVVKPLSMAKTLAHEMGHFIYQQVLGADGKKFWDQAIKGDWGPLNLHEALAKLKPGEDLSGFDPGLEARDPVLALQLQTLMYSSEWSHIARSVGGLERKLAEGMDPIVIVPKTPITGYAGKNTEESFCEAFGMMVAYGPSTLLPMARYWLRVLLPHMKTASGQADKG